jgi:hypothetical protein
VSAEIQLTDGTADALATLTRGAERLVAELAFRTEKQAKDNAHVITGATQTSVSAVTASESHYDQNVQAAAALNPKANFAARGRAREPARVRRSGARPLTVALKNLALRVGLGTPS